MRTIIWIGMAVAAASLLFSAAALAEDPPPGLFRGGTHDGYDADAEINTSDKRGSRNFGGTHAGYTLALLEDVKVRAIPRGTTFTFW